MSETCLPASDISSKIFIHPEKVAVFDFDAFNLLNIYGSLG